MNAEWRWDFTFEILPKMLWATLNTIMAAGIGYAIAMVVGLIFLLGQRTPFRVINVFIREIVEFDKEILKGIKIIPVSEAISILEHSLTKSVIPLNLSESQIENEQKRSISGQEHKENVTH